MTRDAVFRGLQYFLLLIIFLFAVLQIWRMSQWNYGRDVGLSIPRPLNRQQPSKPQRRSQRRKLILLWEKGFEKRPYGFNLGIQPFVDAECPERACETTSDRSRLAVADAVVFHCRNVAVTAKFVRGSIVKGFDMPKSKRRHQRWIFFMQESPIYTGLPLRRFDNLFNWTMTYRKDSDIPMTHGVYKIRPVEERLAAHAKKINYAGNKTRLAAWFVSHCHPHSQREKYVQILRRFIDVDVYGGCGTFKCPKTTNIGSPDCYALLTKRYKFYLAFENSICRDYSSCKYWSMLMDALVVPVVRGGSDYEEDGPPNSFVDANGLTPKELAMKLKEIDADDRLYNSYFDWRKDYYVYGDRRLNVAQSFCHLCSALHNASLPVKWYPDLTKFWSKENDCLNVINPQLERR